MVGNERRNILLREFYALGLQRVSTYARRTVVWSISFICASMADTTWGLTTLTFWIIPVLQDGDLQPLKSADPVQQRQQPRGDPPPASPKRHSQHHEDDRQRAKQPRLSTT